MKLLSALFVLVPFLAVPLLVACPQGPVHPLNDADASFVVLVGDAGRVCALAEERLMVLGCEEGPGFASTCAGTGGVFPLHPDCLADAGTKEAARKCGSVRCP